MAQPGHKHKMLKLECCVAGCEVKKKPVTVRLVPNKDPLQSLLSRVPKKYPFIAQMPDTAWTLAVNDKIDKDDSESFIQVLSQIAPKPVPVVQIIDVHLVITFHYNDNTFDYKLQSDTTQWNNDHFLTMMQSVCAKFGLKDTIDVYEDLLGEHIPIDDMDDIAGAFDSIEHEEDDDDQKHHETDSMKNKTLLHLFVKVNSQSKHLKLIYGHQSFMWVPPKSNTEDDVEWNNNYNALLTAINREYSLSQSNIELLQNDDGEEIEIQCGDDLMATWLALAEDDLNHIVEIVVLDDSVSSKSKQTTGDAITDEKEEAQETGECTPETNLNDNNATQHLSTSAAIQTLFHDQIGLPQYLPLFLAAGYKDLSSITEDDLVRLGVKKPEHRNKILHEIRKLNAAHDLKEKMDVDADEEIKEDVEEVMDLRIEEMLSHLGNDIGALSPSEKAMCFTNITNIKEEAELDEKSALRFTQMFRRICQKESEPYQECVISFLDILQYTVTKHPKEKGRDFHEYTIKGHPNKNVLEAVTAKFHHLIHAMEDPITDIYRDLDIKIPSTSDGVIEHDTGIYDDTFIIFELPQILMENQQSSLVNKTILNPNHLERFINFIVPGSSKKLCHDIYFEKLKTQSVYPVGLFGSRR
eukprot:923928_1